MGSFCLVLLISFILLAVPYNYKNVQILYTCLIKFIVTQLQLVFLFHHTFHRQYYMLLTFIIGFYKSSAGNPKLVSYINTKTSTAKVQLKK